MLKISELPCSGVVLNFHNLFRCVLVSGESRSITFIAETFKRVNAGAGHHLAGRRCETSKDDRVKRFRIGATHSLVRPQL